MFDTGWMVKTGLGVTDPTSETKQEALRRLRRELEPGSLAVDNVVAVPDAFAPLFPLPGLQRGRLVGVTGNGGWSVGYALAGAAAGTSGWVAMIEVGNAGFSAAQELGVPLERLLVLQSIPVSKWASVVAALVEVVDVVVVNPRRPINVRDARRLRARIQEQQALLISVDGGRHWPDKLDVELEAKVNQWTGLGCGYGFLQHREFEIIATGRRSLSGRQRKVCVKRGNGRFVAATGKSDYRDAVVGPSFSLVN